jgi:hypothetical protein
MHRLMAAIDLALKFFADHPLGSYFFAGGASTRTISPRMATLAFTLTLDSEDELSKMR